MKIHFHGASVTAQKDKGGYFYHVQKLVATKGLDWELSRSAFGAAHFNDAGYYFFCDALQENADIYVLDWVSTSARDIDDKKLTELIRLVLSFGKIVVLWNLPRRDDPVGQRLIVKKSRDLASHLNVMLCDISNCFTEEQLNLYLRDIVHTSSLGAERYAQVIFDYINNNLIVDEKPVVDEDLRYLKSNHTLPLIVHENAGPCLKINIEFDNKNELVGVALEHIIGPHSGLVEVKLEHSSGFEKI